MKSRSASLVPVLAIIAVSLFASYMLYTSGIFAVSQYHDTWVEPFRWKSYQVWVTEGDTLSGSFEVISDGTVDFFVMTEIEYQTWTRMGGYPSSVYTRTGVNALNWSVGISDDGTYFVLYSNDGGSSSEHIQGAIIVLTSRSIVWPVIVTASFISAALLICTKLAQRVRDEASF